ncbi:tetratricopeptide repeat protein [Stenotrophomonas sp. HITSZ_GD]|uniref:tetratricopeptide repeat protein n=1 Tax=Stenotrophomonas sp. HITSZ_GD TaxID=3037248 RepID=UPI00240E0C43|nr:tetratricopeptide repeat protein [Stenotrophomonas sp. HITSZ_GD]MDG2526793.1 tetratricopeptide repeat protein [Stenotrophomonas sp. HITSZ_GD]
MNDLPAMVQAFHFLRPQVLWALLLVPLLAVLWRLRLRRADAWRANVDAHLLPALLVAGGRTLWIGFTAGLLACVLGVLALAGPSWRQEAQPMFRTHSPLVIALDLSTRIQAADLPPSRLLQARAKLAELLRERRGGEVALLAYAGDSFTVAPLTDDAGNVALFLDALDPSVMPVGGQRGDRAIAAAVKLLQQAEFAHGDILLLTDRADAAARTQAAQARAAGYRVSALGLGTPQGAAYREDDGRILQARLEEDTLQRLAASGGGAYARLQRGDDDLRALGVLDPTRTDEAAGEDAQGQQWRDEGYWLLPAVMLLLLPAFRRRGALLLLALCVTPALAPPAHAAEGTPWRRADQVEQQQLQAGVDAYRRGDFAAAQRRFEGIDSDQGWYNLGNALARQGRYDDAIAAYDKALAKHPRMADAVANRAAVDAARKRNGGHNDDGAQGQGQQGAPNQNNAGQPKPGQQQPGQSPSSPQDARNNAGPKQPAQPAQAAQDKPPPSPRQQDGDQATPQQADRQAQQQADAAQRERMRQAMAQQQAQAPQQAQAVRGEETPQQREQRQALEAWMRRVPDDPGSLLRTKFRLEQERRQREQP